MAINNKDASMLIIFFSLLLLTGLGNRIFQKLMTTPMHNYALTENLLATAICLPVNFAYIIPMSRNGVIGKEQIASPKRPFVIMGALDACVGLLQMFSATYLPGPLLILLSQAAIPVSMIISKYLLKSTYTVYQYVGASVVAIGIVCVLAPSLGGEGSLLWACMMILSTFPMALSSIYKEMALGEGINPMYLNGWIAVFQLIFSLFLCVPASLASSPPVPILDVPQSLLDGLYCYVGINSQTCDSGSSSECTPDDCFPAAPIFVNLFLFFNQAYNLFILLVIKHGSTNLFYMALTLMVPLGNVAFTLPFVPGNAPLQVTDIIGLVIILSGLVCYRFAADLSSQWQHLQWPDIKASSSSSYYTYTLKNEEMADKKPLLDKYAHVNEYKNNIELAGEAM